MENKHITHLLPEYLDNLLDESQKKSLESHLKECTACTKELEDLKILFKSIKDEEIKTPSSHLRDNFFSQIELEKQEGSKVVSIVPNTFKNKSWGNLFKIAASIALLIGSFVLGTYQQEKKGNAEMAILIDESAQIKQTAMLSLMGNKSASKRIQGVNYVDELVKPDHAIVKAIADRMLYDENTNVRRTAAEALGNFASSIEVKNAFITALQDEKDPAIQIIIIHALVKIQEKKAIAPMQELLKNEETQPFVKEQIKSVLSNII